MGPFHVGKKKDLDNGHTKAKNMEHRAKDTSALLALSVIDT